MLKAIFGVLLLGGTESDKIEFGERFCKEEIPSVFVKTYYYKTKSCVFQLNQETLGFNYINGYHAALIFIDATKCNNRKHYLEQVINFKSKYPNAITKYIVTNSNKVSDKSELPDSYVDLACATDKTIRKMFESLRHDILISYECHVNTNMELDYFPKIKLVPNKKQEQKESKEDSNGSKENNYIIDLINAYDNCPSHLKFEIGKTIVDSIVTESIKKYKDEILVTDKAKNVYKEIIENYNTHVVNLK